MLRVRTSTLIESPEVSGNSPTVNLSCGTCAARNYLYWRDVDAYEQAVLGLGVLEVGLVLVVLALFVKEFAVPTLLPEVFNACRGKQPMHDVCKAHLLTSPTMAGTGAAGLL